ncbi:MAG TPA: ABC transporter permease [Thermoanaerobaculia bacterium]|nr:ABC transporter permease [Thermoanaerobaculia bacterium]
MDSLLADIRFALRQFAKRPLFTAVVVVTLALGIGGNAAIFTVADQVLLRPLPYAEPEALVRVYTQFPSLGFERFWMSGPELMELAEWNRSFTAVGAWADGSFNVSDGENPVRVRGAAVNAAFFDVLGVAPVRGRWITAAEDQPAADPVAVLGHDLWERAFGGDPEVVGRTIQVDGITRTVVGVAPPGFDIADAGLELWLPLQLDPTATGGRGSHYLDVVARLAEGTSVEAARQEMHSLLARWDETFGEGEHHPNEDGHALVVHPLHVEAVGSARTPVLLLLGAVACVLLIACANVANLLLARAESRKREIAVRASLGAERARLVRQFLTESVVLSLAGGACGLLLAWGGLELALAANPGAVPRAAGIQLDGRAFAFTAAVALLTGLLFGLAPALRARAGDLFAGLKDGGRTSAGLSTLGVRRVLVAAELALATLLVLGAGLLLRSFWTLQQVDPGFDPGGTLSFQISLPSASYPDSPGVRAFYDRLLERLEALPGVATAAAFSGLPPARDVNANSTEFEGVEETEDRPANVDYYQIVTPGYFQAMGVPIVAGRPFQAGDTPTSAPVAVINQALAERFYPNENPVGKRIRRGWFGDDEPWYTVVGVAADVKQGGIDQPTGTELYLLHGQWDNVEGLSPPRTLYLAVRTAGDPLAQVPGVRRAVGALDPSLPLAEVKTLDRAVADSLTRPRFVTLLVAVFAAIALLLAAVGTYGVLAYAVEERRHEVGVRMALGADAGRVLRMVVGQGMRPVIAGLVLGLAGALLTGRLLASQLYGVTATDPVTYAVVPAVLVAVALVACLIPGRSATRTDPATALRSD